MKLLGVEEYHVGWICALSLELAASKAMLDEEHEMIHDKDPDDPNAYALGRIGNHNVVLACLPAGVDGTNAAAVVATNLSRTFRSIKFGLLVGIGGGVPFLDNHIDIRLGDIVVSQPTATNGGVIQYDKGKGLTDHGFEIKGSLNSPPSVLLTAIQLLQADHMMKGSQIPFYLQELQQRYPKMVQAGYIYPGQEQDCLHCDECRIPHQSCNKCDGGLVIRVPRTSLDPEIHYGVIASGNQVVKDAVERNRIRALTSAKCIEMEAAGLMNSFPCLVVRGICDYADKYKNDKWHTYAAATAAAYAKTLLSYVSPTQTSHERSISTLFGESSITHFNN